MCVCTCVYVNECAFFCACVWSLFSRCLEKCKYESVLRSSQRERILFDALSHRESHRGKAAELKEKDVPFFCHSITPLSSWGEKLFTVLVRGIESSPPILCRIKQPFKEVCIHFEEVAENRESSAECVSWWRRWKMFSSQIGLFLIFLTLKGSICKLYMI